MIYRRLTEALQAYSEQFPVVFLTGPRQSGKTTLLRSLFAEKPYASLEDPDVREFALEDPRGFLATYPEGAVLDEVQRAPVSVRIRLNPGCLFLRRVMCVFY